MKRYCKPGAACRDTAGAWRWRLARWRPVAAVLALALGVSVGVVPPALARSVGLWSGVETAGRGSASAVTVEVPVSAGWRLGLRLPWDGDSGPAAGWHGAQSFGRVTLASERVLGTGERLGARAGVLLNNGDLGRQPRLLSGSLVALYAGPAPASAWPLRGQLQLLQFAPHRDGSTAGDIWLAHAAWGYAAPARDWYLGARLQAEHYPAGAAEQPDNSRWLAGVEVAGQRARWRLDGSLLAVLDGGDGGPGGDAGYRFELRLLRLFSAR